MGICQHKTVEGLIALAQLDVDAVLAYEQAIRNIDSDESDIIETLRRFQEDHFRHIDDLARVVEALGGQAPRLTRDLKGFVIEGMTRLMSKVGTRTALLAMVQNEMLTNSAYQSATETVLPREAQTLVARHCADEQRHLGVIKQALMEQFGIEQGAKYLAGLETGATLRCGS